VGMLLGGLFDHGCFRRSRGAQRSENASLHRCPQTITGRDEDICDAYRVEGADKAMQKFLADAGLARGPPSRRTHPKWEPSPEQLARMRAATEQLLAHLLRPTTRYRPDIEALRAASTRIVVAGEATSKGQLANRTAVALADQLGTTLVDFPVTTADSWPSLSSSAASWTRCSPKRPDRLRCLSR